uniref:Uncharacterized protein n=1 Tax=Anguilla anguilla TaxID=7936 RepID=A0A0E9VWJ4_ANGAN
MFLSSCFPSPEL